MTTMVVLDEVFKEEDATIFAFRVAGSKEMLFVDRFYNGIATIWTESEDESRISAKVIAGCFDEKSNFANELSKLFFGDETHNKLEAIHLNIYGTNVTLEIKKPNR